MSIINIIPSKVDGSNFLVGRGPCAAPIAVVLHEGIFSISDSDALHCRSRRANFAHTSFHFAVDGSLIHQYVGIGDTAVSFGNTETPPTLPAGCPTGTPDQKTVNVWINWTVPFDTECHTVDTPDTSYLCRLLAHIYSEIGLTPDLTNLVTATGELMGLNMVELLSCVQATIPLLTSAPALYAPQVSCFISHETIVYTAADGIAVWDGNCIKEATGPVSLQKCDYFANLVNVNGGFTRLSYITVNGNIISVPPALQLITFPNAPALQSWLNSLGLGVFVINYVSGNAGVFDVLISSIQNENVVNSVAYGLPSTPSTIVPLVQSNCTTSVVQAPLTVQNLINQIAASATDSDSQVFTSPDGSLVFTPLPPSASGKVDYQVGISPAILASIGSDDQTFSSSDGSIIITPSAPTGPDGQVNYNLTVNPAILSSDTDNQVITSPLGTILVNQLPPTGPEGQINYQVDINPAAIAVQSVTFNPALPKGLTAGVLNLPPKFLAQSNRNSPIFDMTSGSWITMGMSPATVVNIPRAGQYRIQFTLQFDVVPIAPPPPPSQSNITFWSRLVVNGVPEGYGFILVHALSLQSGTAHGEGYQTFEKVYTLPAGPVTLDWEYLRINYSNPASHRIYSPAVNFIISGPEDE